MNTIFFLSKQLVGRNHSIDLDIDETMICNASSESIQRVELKTAICCDVTSYNSPKFIGNILLPSSGSKEYAK
jgi:hypothetical protein